MPSAKNTRSRNKLLKIEVGSSSESESEHELLHYAKDKVKLMKEVLKLIKPKKIKSMAPDCIKNLDIVEINSMLLEELLGISNKRLQYIFNGENVDRETSSSESEEEKQPIDVISLDDISDDDDIELCISDSEKNSLENVAKKSKKDKPHKIKTEVGETSIKLEKTKKDKKKSKKPTDSKKQSEPIKEDDKEKLMSVLELLELQARARAIRSQLAIENEKKKTSESEKNTAIKIEEGSDSDDVIIESPEHKEIVIASSESDEENHASTSQSRLQKNIKQNDVPPQKKQKSIHTSETENVDSTYPVGEPDNAETANKENDDLDNNKKRQRLMAKIQKVRLIRNRSKNADVRSISKTLNKDNDNIVDNIIATACPTSSEINENQLVARDDVTIDETQSQDEKQLQDIKQLKDDQQLEDKKQAENRKQPEDQIENEKQLEKNEESSKMKSEGSSNLTEGEKNNKVPNDKNVMNNQVTSIKQPTDNSYCDNDEIVVINLDDDEMEGIENV